MWTSCTLNNAGLNTIIIYNNYSNIIFFILDHDSSSAKRMFII